MCLSADIYTKGNWYVFMAVINKIHIQQTYEFVSNYFNPNVDNMPIPVTLPK